MKEETSPKHFYSLHSFEKWEEVQAEGLGPLQSSSLFHEDFYSQNRIFNE